ncbi:hypothetical protein DENSPDRAFT_931111 [Dentipellis sp. KUC8613]|nr:hypothetical protein DENSPDRAFT_931111 [Dentipellis sp. KUC8613]
MPRSSQPSGTSSSSKVWDDFKLEAEQAIKKRKLAATNALRSYGANSSQYNKAIAHIEAMERRNKEDWAFRLQNEGLPGTKSNNGLIKGKNHVGTIKREEV